jgi:hypothetical protein
MLKSYRELQVCQRSIQLATAVYRLAAGFPRDEVYGLSSQMKRVAVSVASNIAEGYGRLALASIDSSWESLGDQTSNCRPSLRSPVRWSSGMECYWMRQRHYRSRSAKCSIR